MSLEVKNVQGKMTTCRFNKEGSGDGAQVPLYMNLKMSAPAVGILETILDNPAAGTAFWTNDEDRRLIYPTMGKQETIAKVENVQATIHGTKLKNCRLSKCSFTPMGGGMITFECVLIAPEATAEQEHVLKLLLKNQIRIGLKGGELVEDEDPQKDIEDQDEE